MFSQGHCTMGTIWYLLVPIWSLLAAQIFHAAHMTRKRRSLQWRHNERDSVSNHQPHECSFNYLFRRRSRKTSKLRVSGLCARNSLVTGVFLAQRPVTRKMFPFHDVCMIVLQTVHTVIKLPHLYGPKYLLENNFLQKIDSYLISLRLLDSYLPPEINEYVSCNFLRSIQFHVEKM